MLEHEPQPAASGPRAGRSVIAARLGLAVYWMLLATLTHWPRLLSNDEPDPPLTDPVLLLQGDKVVHAGAFGLLALLLIRARLFDRVAGSARNLRWATLLAVGYAVVDEWTQGLSPERTVSAGDMLANATGIVGVYLWLAGVPGWPGAPGDDLTPSRQDAKTPRWEWIGAGGLLLALAVVLSYWRGLGGAGFAVAGVVSFGAAGCLYAGLGRSAASAAGRWAALVGVVLGLIVVAVGVEATRMVGGEAISFAYLFAHHLGAVGWVLCIAVVAAMRGEGSSADWGAGRGVGRYQGVDPVKPSEQSAPVPANTSRFVGHAVLVSAMTLVSRFTGLLRDAILAAALGLSGVADAFFIGFLIPNLFRRLFGEGALTAAFIPQYTELIERDPVLARRFASATIAGLTVVLLAITLIVELALWWLATQVEAGSKSGLAVMYTRIMLPYMPLVCLVAMVGGVLQVHKRFGPPAAAPVLLNLVMILAVLVPTAMLRDTGDPQRTATWLAVSVLVAGVGQFLWQIVVMARVSGLTRQTAGIGPSVKKMLVMMGPMVIGLAVFQINSLMDSLIAFFLAPGEIFGESIQWFGQTVAMPLQRGDVAALQWSQRLYQFPLGVFGIAIATAIFPALSAAAAKWSKVRDESGDAGLIETEQEAFARILRQGLRLTLFIGLPASVGLILTRVPLARVVYERGAFGNEDSLRVATILAGYSAAVWAYSMTHTITRAFYALQDAKTPLKVSVGMVCLNLSLNLTLIWPLGAAGLAWSTAISAAGQVALLLWLIRKRVPRPIDHGVLRSWARTGLATLLMAGALAPVPLLMDVQALSLSGVAAVLVAMVVGGMAVVLAVAWFSGAEELHWLRRRRMK